MQLGTGHALADSLLRSGFGPGSLSHILHSTLPTSPVEECPFSDPGNLTQ